MSGLPCPTCGGAGELEFSIGPYGKDVFYRTCTECDGAKFMVCDVCGEPAVVDDVVRGPVCKAHQRDAA